MQQLHATIAHVTTVLVSTYRSSVHQTSLRSHRRRRRGNVAVYSARWDTGARWFDHNLHSYSDTIRVKLMISPPPHHNRFSALFRDHPGEPVPEENFWTLWCKGRLTQADTLTIRLGATASGLTSAHLHHPPYFYRPDALPATQPTVSKHWRQLASPFPQIDIIGAMVIVWRVRGEISRLFCAILCATIVHSAMHTHMNRPNRSLDWVLSHWAHFTVLRFIFVYVNVCIFCMTVYCMNV